MTKVIQGRVHGRTIELTEDLGLADGQEVDVQLTIRSPAKKWGEVGSPALAPEEWRQRVLETAGQWQGELERPEQGEFEQRESLP